MITPGQLRTLALAGNVDEKAALERLDHLVRLHEPKGHVAGMARLLVRFAFVRIDPCPCCGNRDLYYGPMSVMSWGIHCWRGDHGGCGVKISREIDDDIDDWLAFTLAVKAWNRRPQGRPPDDVLEPGNVWVCRVCEKPD